MTPFMLAVFVGILAVAAEVADRMPVPADRYRRIEDFADCGLGADEYRGPRRYTRPSEALDTKGDPGANRQASTGASITHQHITRQEMNR